jgi:hypothetical protein
VDEGQGQPARRQRDEQQQRETQRSPDAEPVDQTAEADDHQDQRNSRDPDQGIRDSGDGAPGPRPVSALIGMGGEGLCQLCRLPPSD